MKIDGTSAHSINFIEQKKSNASTPERNLTLERTDTFVGKSMSSTALLESNESMAILQVAHKSITKLQTSGEELQKLNEKFSYFKTQESELITKFEEITGEMLDVVDNTMFKDRGLFYAQHTLSIGNSEFSFSMISNDSIEDFSLGVDTNIDSFIEGLNRIKDDITQIKNYVEVANFNQMAALHVNSPLADIEPDILSKEAKIPSINIDEIKQAHDMNLLKDKVSHLLED